MSVLRKIISNASLATASFDSLRLAGLLEVVGNAELQSLALPALEKVDVRLTVNLNPTMTTFDAPALATVGVAFNFEGNAAMTSLVLPTLVSANNINVRNSTLLTRIEARSLVFITTGLILLTTPQLTTLQFPELISIGGAVLIRGTGLPNATGFAGLTSIGGDFTVDDNSAWGSFAGMGGLQAVFGSFAITNNAALANFNGLGSFVEVGENLTIANNPSLPQATAQAFANRITVHGTTTIN